MSAALEKLGESMDSCMVSLDFKAQAQEFLPNSALDDLIQQSEIEEVVNDKDLDLSEEERITFVKKIFSDGRKLFAICVYCGLPMDCLWRLLRNGLTDTDIPLSAGDCPSPTYRRQFVTGFLVNQKRFNVPSFSMNSFERLDDSRPIPIELDEGALSLLGNGAFGVVYRIRIHEEYFSFWQRGQTGNVFAVKVVHQQASIERERKFIEAMAAFNHKNLVKCLASFTFGAKYHMIYELADGNLEEFMQKHKRLTVAKDSELDEAWLVRQLCGLAGALAVIHNQEDSVAEPSNSLLAVPDPAKLQKSGYIHDIKTENILVFGNRFSLSDFSCAKVVDFIATISGQSHQTLSRSGTPTTKPPEAAQSGKTSRPYDLWSLGCVFLDVLTWFLEGYAALDEFRSAREGPVRPGGAEDDGFYYTAETGGKERWQLREPVVAKISKLQTLCQGDLRTVLDYVPSLLRINPKERPTAAALARTLKPLDTDADLVLARKDSAMHLKPEASPLPKLPVYDDSDAESNQWVSVQRPTEEEFAT